MIPLVKETEESFSEEFVSNDYQINATAAAFAATVDTLYQDKVLSPMREYMVNAADAHIEAGHTRNFDVYLPTTLQPIFKVRDYGPGLSHEKILTHMTTMFSSGKADTNEQTGYLGLGSKSVFAYTDFASLESIQNGIKRVYVLARSGSSVPTVTLTSETSTDEHDGLVISYAVKPSDISRFKEAAATLRRGFNGYKVCPTFHPPLDVVDPNNSVLIYATDKASLYRNSRGYSPSKVFVRQGPIIYPVPHKASGLSTYHTELVVNVPIGSLAVATSRETLSLDSVTDNLVKNFIEEAVNDICDELQEEINQCTSYIEACKKFSHVTEQISGPTLRYKNHSEVRPIISLTLPAGCFWDRGSKRKGSMLTINTRTIDSLMFYYTEPHEFVTRKVDRVAIHVDSLNQPNTQSIILDRLPSDGLKDLSEKFELRPDQFVNIVNLPAPPPVQRITTRRSTSGYTPNSNSGAKPYKLIRDYNATHGVDWVQVDELPANNEYLWLPAKRKGGSLTMTRGTITGLSPQNFGSGIYDFSGQKVWFSNLSRFVDSKPVPLYAILPSVEKAFKPSETRLLDVFIESELSKLDIDILVAAWVRNHNAGSKIFPACQNLNQYIKEFTYTENLATLLNIAGLQSAVQKEAEAFFREAKKRYPLLDAPESELRDFYIKAIDKSRPKRKTKGKKVNA